MTSSSIPLRATGLIRAGAQRRGTVRDTLLLSFEERQAPKGTFTGLRGTAIAVDLPAERLRTDDCLSLEDGSLAEIVARPEPLLEARAKDAAALARIAFHLGDRHIPAELSARRIRVRSETATEALLAALGAAVTPIEAPFEPEGGAYAHDAGHDHGHGGHDHAHHHHDHGHCHDHGHDRRGHGRP